jgi:hypothetical protein
LTRFILPVDLRQCKHKTAQTTIRQHDDKIKIMGSEFLRNVNPRKSLLIASFSSISQHIIARPGASAVYFRHVQSNLFKKIPPSRVSMYENLVHANPTASFIKGKDSYPKISRFLLFEGL